MNKVIAIAVALSFLSRLSTGQEVLLQIEGFGVGGEGNRVATLGDVTGDGSPDLIIGQVGTRRLWVVDGLDGGLIHEVVGETNDYGAAFAGLGDFDGDGVSDFAVGETGYPDIPISLGRAVVYSGATGGVLAQVVGPSSQSFYGFSIGAVGDVDADGYADFAFGGFYGIVHVHRGPDGAYLRSHQGPGTRPVVTGIGDIDGDGHSDYIVGWCQDSQGGLWAGTAVVYSGRTGAVIHQVFGSIPQNKPFTSGDHLGRAVAGVGDIDGDGIPDFACGAPGEFNPHWGDIQQRVLVYSGADASLLLELDKHREIEYNSWFGGALAGGLDVNGDGVPDIVVGAPNEKGPFTWWSGSINVYSGRTGVRLWRVFTTIDARTGSYVALVGDLNGDGLADFASGDRAWAGNTGRILVWAGFQADAESVCPPSPSSVGGGAQLEVGGDIAIGSSWHTEPELIASNAPPGTPALFCYGPPSAPQPFGDGMLCMGTPIQRLGPPQLVEPDGSLRRVISFEEPPAGSGPGKIHPGSTWTFQLWYRDPTGGAAGFNLSEALSVTFAP